VTRADRRDLLRDWMEMVDRHQAPRAAVPFERRLEHRLPDGGRAGGRGRRLGNGAHTLRPSGSARSASLVLATEDPEREAGEHGHQAEHDQVRFDPCEQRWQQH
jgi:hypothetical protein